MLFTIAATVVCLGVLIFVHELGHFLAAKSVDIEVSRFSIGFGPKLFGFQRGETEYVISAFPLGGYVKMEGMVGEDVVEPLEGRSDSERQPSPRDFDQKPLWARFYVIVAGVVMNTLFAIVVFSLIAGINGVNVPLVTGVTPGSPAEGAGIQAGDLIVSVEGRRVNDFADVARDIQMRPDEEITMQVRRGEQLVPLRFTTGSERHWSDLNKDSVDVGVIGIETDPDRTHRALGPVAALGAGIGQTWRWTVNIGGFVGRIFSGRDSASELGGPILIGQMSGQFARLGLLPFLQFMAIISVNLAVLNLLPIPVLDGGHLLFLAVEGVRGREVSVEQRIRLTQVGMLFVLGLMVLAIANDIFRLLG
ncbi:MAG: RIP metalloprotease RseP [Gemmatimonadales bacterium]|jgi:regulator of sigma E protease